MLKMFMMKTVLKKILEPSKKEGLIESIANFLKNLYRLNFDYLAVICPSDGGNDFIRINDLYVSELTRAMSETGYAIKGLDVIELKMLLFMKWVLILP
jgi:hypothetical protein